MGWYRLPENSPFLKECFQKVIGDTAELNVDLELRRRLKIQPKQTLIWHTATADVSLLIKTINGRFFLGSLKNPA
jgi:hypothetical protein